MHLQLYKCSAVSFMSVFAQHVPSKSFDGPVLVQVILLLVTVGSGASVGYKRLCFHLCSFYSCPVRRRTQKYGKNHMKLYTTSEMSIGYYTFRGKLLF